MQKKYTHILLYPLIVTSYLNANRGCDISAIIAKASSTEKISPTFKIREEKINIRKETKKKFDLKITERLNSISIVHENQTIVIKRTPRNQKHTCPPFCIQPMNINGIKTVGELEVLDFIKELNGKEAKLFIDVRESREYNINTIPGAINIPYSMLKPNSKYQKEILTLLGGKKRRKKWIFKSTPTLLIFGASNENNKASKVIKMLLKLSYPNKRIYYYRAGIKGWKDLGLSLY